MLVIDTCITQIIIHFDSEGMKFVLIYLLSFGKIIFYVFFLNDLNLRKNEFYKFEKKWILYCNKSSIEKLRYMNLILIVNWKFKSILSWALSYLENMKSLKLYIARLFLQHVHHQF